MRLILILLAIVPHICLAQPIDKKLQEKVQLLASGFKGNFGICIKNLATQRVVQINADTIFPTASIVKVPILIGTMQQIKTKQLAYHKSYQFLDSLRYDDEDITGMLKDSSKMELAKIIMLMLTTSDNTASLWLQKLAGTGTAINSLLANLGLEHTRVNSRTPQRESYRKIYGWGQTTPKEMANIFEKMYHGQVVDDSTSKKMIRLLGRNYWDEQAISQIPVTTFVASKNGCVNKSRSEVLLVMGKQPYILSIFTKNNVDERWSDDNEAWQLTLRISKLVWETYGE